MPATGPLKGVRVLDLSAVVSGPMTASMLADQGAAVTKVERPGSGDIQRNVGSRRRGMSGFFHIINRGKRSIALDIRTTAGRDIIHRLAGRCDVVIQNYRPGVLDRLGLGYPHLSAINPGLIYLSISGFGPDGPVAGQRAYDAIIQACSGMCRVQGSERDHEPEQINQLVLDKITALKGLQAITAALFSREKTGRGQHIHLAMLDVALAFMWGDAAADFILQGDGVEHFPPIRGSGHLTRFRDGWAMTMTLSDHEFEGICRAFDLGYLAADPRFSTPAARQGNREILRQTLRPAIDAVAARMPLAEGLARLAENEVPAARLPHLQDLPEDPQADHNGIFVETNHPVAGPMRETRPAARFSETPVAPAGPAPLAGQHTLEILAELGMQDQAAALLREGIISVSSAAAESDN